MRYGGRFYLYSEEDRSAGNKKFLWKRSRVLWNELKDFKLKV